MPTYLVVGATGQQGGGVINALLSHGSSNCTIRAMTRNISSPSATALQKKGVTPVKGDLLDKANLVKALEGADGAYLVTDFRGPGDIEGEMQQGRNFIEAAKEAGIKHVVLSSVAGADIAQAVDHFYTKFRLEEELRASGLDWTIIRPVGFMEVIPAPGIARFFFLSAMAALMGTTKQRYVACDDIGKAVALALTKPDRFRGKVVTIAGQVADVDALERSLEEGEGRKGWGRMWMPRWLIIRMTPFHYRQMFDWLYYENCQPGDVDATKELIPDLLDIQAWAGRQQAQRAAGSHPTS